MEAKLIKLNEVEFLHSNTAEVDDVEYSILERVSGSVRPRCSPNGIKLLEQHTYRNALFSYVTTLQIFKDDNWNEFRVRNIQNGDTSTSIDVFYRNRTLENIVAHMNRTIQQETTI